MTGGRSDLTYSVVCEHCDRVSCVPCGEKVRFEPRPTDLTETTVVVGDLDSHLNYTFTVETHSGVSQYSTRRPTESITTALDYTGELSSIRPCGVLNKVLTVCVIMQHEPFVIFSLQNPVCNRLSCISIKFCVRSR